MNIELTSLEARVMGCLIEKEITTPEQYPLSLNALVNACNQKSSREPVLALSDADVQNILDGLNKKHLISEKTGFGSRVVKYKHRLCNTEFSELQLSDQALGIICVLLLRGPQTPGELRTRTNRLCQFDDVNRVESVLRELATREDGLVVQLPREAGKRDARYAHLLSGEITGVDIAPATVNVATTPVFDNDRIELLELDVAELRQELDELKKTLRAMES